MKQAVVSNRLFGLVAATLLALTVTSCSTDNALPTGDAPTVEILSPAPRATETGDVVTMTCVVSENTERVSYRVNGGESVEVEFSSLEYSFPIQGLVDGENTIELSITSDLGTTTRSLLDIIWLPGSKLEARDDAIAVETQRTTRISVLSNDRGRNIALDSFTQPENGTVREFTTPGVLEYDPEDGFVGSDTFDYTIRDRNGKTDTATVDVNVTPRNPEAPNANDDRATTTINREVVIDVLANDTDPDNDKLSIAQGSVQTKNGSLVFLADGFDGNRVKAVKYIPNADFVGTDSFSYYLSDSDGFNEGDGGDEAMVTVTVNPVENPGEPEEPEEPVEPEEPEEPLTYNAIDDVATTTPNREIDISVLNNDKGPEGATLSISEGKLAPEHGRLIFLKDGFQGGIQVAVKYIPDPDFVGTDSFSYVLNESDEATVTVNVRNP